MPATFENPTIAGSTMTELEIAENTVSTLTVALQADNDHCFFSTEAQQKACLMRNHFALRIAELEAAAKEEAKEPSANDHLLKLGGHVGGLMDRVDALEKRARESMSTMALLKAWNETRHILNIRRDHNEAIVHMDAAIMAVTNSTEGEKCTDAIPTKS